MTLRTKTLTAVAALTISAAGFAFAQTAAPEAEAEQPVQAQEAPAADSAAEAASSAAEAVEEAAGEAGAALEGAAQDAQDAVADAVDTATDAADTDPAAETETVAEEAAEGETATDAPASDATPQDDPAAETATEEVLDEQATPEPTESAVEESEAEQAAPADAAEETAVQAEAAPEVTVIEGTPEEALEEQAAAGDPEAEAEAEGEEEEGGYGHIEDVDFSFEGPFGTFDQFQLQRGLQVYTEVCSACHGLRYVPIRTLADDGGPGLPEDQVRAYAANLAPVVDPETGEERPRLPTDHFPAVSGEGMGPDLSLMAKARAGFHGPVGTGISQLINGIGGPEYIHAILTSYTGEEVEQAGSFLYVNTAFSGGKISMPAPLSDDLVTYEDGTEATVDQMATDLSAFLMWTAEPKMMARKKVGFVSVLMLLVLSGLLYYTNKRLWAPYKGKDLHKQ